MPNKHFCQGPESHTKTTSDRFLKSKGILRGRYAYSKIATSNNEDERWHRYDYRSDTYFCSLTCESNWLSAHMEDIEHGRPIAFIRHRRITEGYKKVTENSYGRNWTTIRKIGVDNDSQ